MSISSQFMLPKFPKFKKIAFKDKIEIEKITSKFLPYSDFNFISLYSYDVEEDALVSNLNDNLVIKFRDYITNEPFYSFIGKNDVTNTADKLLDLAKKEKIMHALQLIPEHVVNDELRQKLVVNEDKNNFDYILSTSVLSELSGGDFGQKRWRKNQFIKENSPEIVDLDLVKEKTKSEIIDLFTVWGKTKNKTPKETIHERKALKRLLNIAKHIELVAIGIYINKHLVGFSIEEKLNKDWAIGHFMKTDPTFAGGTETLFYLTAKRLAEMKIKYINAEQDLGAQSLRYFKSSWKPIGYHKKYKIQPK